MTENFVLKNKYNIEKKLQESKLGKTFLAKSDDINTFYIIKTVKINKFQPDKQISIIQNEAQVLSNLKHTNIPKLIDIFTEEDDKNINIYLVQEYIKGENLQQLIDKGQKFSEKEVISIAIKICDILNYIHSFSPSIIHQDIKPANIIMSENNQIYLIDFGAVKQKILSGENEGLSTIIGTQGYMSIEQFEGKSVSGSDIYSLGLTMLGLITGKHPLSLDKTGLVFDFKNINISKDLKKIVIKMTDPDWKKRYLTSNELKEELEFFSSNQKLSNDKINFIFNSKKSVSKIIKEQISFDEKLKFFRKSKGVVEIPFKHIIVSFLKYSIIGLALFLFTSIFYKSIDIESKSMGILSYFLFTLAIIIPFISFLKQISFFKSKTYVVTNKRVMVIESENNYKKVQSYNNLDIKNVMITKKYNGSYGDIIFIRNDETNVLIKKIENVDIFFNLLKEIIKKNESNQQI